MAPSNLPLLRLGDLIYGGQGGGAERLPGDTSNVRVFLREQSSDGNPAAPAWDVVTLADIMGDGATLLAYLAPAVVELVEAGGLVQVNAQQGNVFTLTLLASTWTIQTPANPVDGQPIRIRLTQGPMGSQTVTWDDGYSFGAAGVPVLSTTAAAVDVITFEYNADLGVWCCLGAALGF